MTPRTSTWTWSGAALALVLSTPAGATLPISSIRADTTQADTASVPTDGPVLFKKKNLSGPRLGFTMVMNDDEALQRLRERDMGRVISQFGWHFERQVAPLGGGPQFIIETVPMVGGVEYGEFIPSITLAMGIRWPSGFEVGMGPSISASSSSSRSALVIAAGRSFDYGGVSLPINVALSTNPKGQRLSLIVGYAIQQSR